MDQCQYGIWDKLRVVSLWRSCRVGFVLRVICDGSGPFPVDLYRLCLRSFWVLLISSEGFHITFSSVFSSKVNCALKMRFSSYLDPSPQDLPQSSPWSNRELWELSTVVLSPLLLNAFCHLVSKENDLEEKA